MNRCKSPLVWIDLEMTGLNISVDTILEIAVIITDNELNIIEKGPCFVIKHTKEKLDSMDEWNTKHHGESGLVKASLESDITMEKAEEEVLKFLKKHTIKNLSPLCGNSVWQDKMYIQKYMPKIEEFLHYRIIDVSSIKETIYRWYPDHACKRFIKPENHRALEDIIYSIEELKFYRNNFYIKQDQNIENVTN